MSKPSERIGQLVKEIEENNRKYCQSSQYIPGYVEKLIPSIIRYLDEQYDSNPKQIRNKRRSK